MHLEKLGPFATIMTCFLRSNPTAVQPLTSIDSGVPKSTRGPQTHVDHRFREGGSPYLRGPQIYMTPGSIDIFRCRRRRRRHQW